MISGKKCIAVIPARSGSKGIKNKNIRILNGKPLIAYTIEFSLSCKVIDHTIVSTDSKEYAEIALSYGAEVPYIRPKGIDVVLHSIKWILENINNSEYYFFLQPTSPLRKKEDIDKIIKLFFDKKAEAIVSLCEVDHPPQWIYEVKDDLRLENLLNFDVTSKIRQELKKFYRLNGAFYFGRIPFLLKNKSFYSDRTYAYIMNNIFYSK